MDLQLLATKYVLAPLVSTVTKPLAEQAAALWRTIDWLAAETEYRKRVVNQLNRIRVLGKSHEISLDNVYTDVYVVTEPAHEKYYDDDDDDVRADEILRRLRERTRLSRRKIDEFIEAENHLYLLGSPGAGKTTLMRHIAIRAARGLYDRLPIYVALREIYQDGEPIDRYVERVLDIGGAPDPHFLAVKLLEAGSVILLFDGLDEIPRTQDRRTKYLRQIEALSRKYPKCRLVISCRTAASTHSIEGFKYLELAEFDSDQQDAFLAHWFADDKEAYARFLDIWHEDSSRSLRDLASSPLLLTLLCLAYASTGYFPRKRIDLFRDALNALVYQWDTSRSIERDGLLTSLEPRRKDHLLQSVAYHTFVNAQYVFDEALAVKEVQRYLNMLPPSPTPLVASPDMIRELAANHGVIVERAVRLFSFSHLSIHEYLTACYLHESATAEEWGASLRPEVVTDDRWREVLISLAAIKPNASSIVDTLIAAATNQCKHSESLVQTIRDIRTATARGVSPPNMPRAIGAISPSGERRRLLGARETRYKPSLERSVRLIATYQKQLDPAGKTSFSRNFNAWVQLIGRYDVELFELLRKDKDPDNGLHILAAYFQMVSFILECISVASLSRQRSEYIDQLL